MRLTRSLIKSNCRGLTSCFLVYTWMLHSIISIYTKLFYYYSKLFKTIIQSNEMLTKYRYLPIPKYIYMNLWLELDNWPLLLSWLERPNCGPQDSIPAMGRYICIFCNCSWLGLIDVYQIYYRSFPSINSFNYYSIEWDTSNILIFTEIRTILHVNFKELNELQKYMLLCKRCCMVTECCMRITLWS